MPASTSVADGRDRVVAGLRVARAVGQEDAVGLRAPAPPSARRLRRHDGEAAAALGEHAQDVVLDAEVVGDDVEARRARRAVALAQRPRRRRSTRRARAQLTTRARSCPPSTAPRARARARRAIDRVVERRRRATMQPFCAPLSRRMRVSLRVSMSAMPTMPLRRAGRRRGRRSRESSTRAAAGRG